MSLQTPLFPREGVSYHTLPDAEHGHQTVTDDGSQYNQNNRQSVSFSRDNQIEDRIYNEHSSTQTFFTIFNLTCITITTSAATGLLTVGLPEITNRLALPDNLLLWPISVYYLASGSCLLVAGAIADITDPKLVNVIGTFTLGLSIIASGWSPNGYWLIGARIAQGVSVAMSMPTSVVILTASFPPGRRRNIGFSSLGLAQPLGFSLGLVFGGLIQETSLGWRFGFYLCGAGAVALAVSNWFVVPSGMWDTQFSWAQIMHAIDWIGILISSTSLGCFYYSFAILADSLDAIKEPRNFTILCVAFVLFPAFFLWMHRQEKIGGLALIPNSLWKKLPFLTITLMVLLQWAVVQSMEVYFSLFFQTVQLLSPSQASLRFLPGIAMGVLLNISTGLFVQHMRIDYLVTITSVIAAASPLLLAVTDPGWSFFYTAFWSVLLSPVSVDVIFTIAHLIVVDIFPPKTHALAGAVFNTVAQLGTSIGLAAMAAITAIYSKANPNGDAKNPENLLLGYRAVFWTCFMLMCVSCLIAPVGLRSVGRLGSE
ncbi:aminotriazole resistance protein [Amniculicola lignicola CBS 123094]|uniref:Aminotriazole resistance protein n=1 Tax=Amniculicola lignicola CBS 123094 TaxID=1392246 RepID=A0A6A5WLB9_9PLEO|nr:aminotriazole resistance protein [Amniculicola lignicola CBS 123094]